MLRNTFLKLVNDQRKSKKVEHQISKIEELDDLATIPHFYMGHMESEVIDDLLDDNENIADFMQLNCENLPFDKFIITAYVGSEKHTKIGLLVFKDDLKEIQDSEYQSLVNEDTDRIKYAIQPIRCRMISINDDVGVISPWSSYLSADHDANTIRSMNMITDLKNDAINEVNTEILKITPESIRTAFTMVLMYFFKILNCKNIIIKDEYPGNHKQGKNKRPELAYKAFHIKITGKNIRRKGVVLDSIPLHESAKYGMVGARRGHFRTYSEETGLLFGKHAGTWFWSPILTTKKPVDYTF